MIRLIPFELGKIWRKGSFLLSICILMVINVFLLWYTNLSDEYAPALSSYKLFQKEIKGMTEEEKADYITELKETIDGVSFVQEVLSMQGLSEEMGTALAEQSMESNPGVFEAYYEQYESGEYLKFTDSFWQEKSFIDEMYGEWQKVAGYQEYLQDIQEKKNTLSGISIFNQREEETFASRNIEKSAEDYGNLSDKGIHWMPSKAIRVSMESVWTDLLLLLSVFLFTGSLIMEEKEKKLFYVTRSTRYGVFHSILAKLMSLFFHCMLVSALFYGINLVFAGLTCGWGTVTASIQSVASNMESSISVSIAAYILLSVVTKGLVLFGTGTIFTALCILANHIFVPFLTGFALWGIGWALYTVIPAGSALAAAKYLNIAGILKTEQLYGGYLNLNLFGYPVSRLTLSWCVILLLAAVGILSSILLFSRGKSLELKKVRISVRSYFRPHANLFRHECYKIMITNRALLILLVFGVLLGYREGSRQYQPSVKEQYYQDIMLKLEGELTDEKERLVLAEKAKYEEAFAKLEEIEEMKGAGTISENAADGMKAEWYAVTAFYPAFQRVQQQYQRICERGGSFIYDTGYLYLFGTMDNGFLINLLLLSICTVLSFGNVISMEYQKGAWNLLGATRLGRRKICFRKIGVSVLFASILAVIPFVCRVFSVSKVYPLHGLTASVQDIPYCDGFALPVSVGGFLVLLVASQILAVMGITLVVLGISWWRKNHVQAIFFGVLLLVIPLVLKLLGFEFARWISVYPLYGWTAV